MRRPTANVCCPCSTRPARSPRSCEARQVAVETAAQGLAAAEEVVVLGSRLEDARVLLDADDATRPGPARAPSRPARATDLRDGGRARPGPGRGMFVPGVRQRRAPLPRDRDRAGEPRRRGRRPRAARDRGLRAAGSPGVGDGARDPARGCARTRRRTSSVAHWQRTHGDASSALEQSRAAAQRLEALEAEVTSLSEREDRLVTALASSRAGLEIRTQQHAGVRGQVLGARAAELRELLVDHPGTDQRRRPGRAALGDGACPGGGP